MIERRLWLLMDQNHHGRPVLMHFYRHFYQYPLKKITAKCNILHVFRWLARPIRRLFPNSGVITFRLSAKPPIVGRDNSRI